MRVGPREAVLIIRIHLEFAIVGYGGLTSDK